MELTYKVTQDDLIGHIADFPIEVVERMIYEQVKQGNEPDITIFQNNVYAERIDGGFNWVDTIDGEDFWDSILVNNEFSLFWEKHKEIKKLVYVEGDVDNYNNVIKTLERCGGINENELVGNNPQSLYYIEPLSHIIKCVCFTTNTSLYEVIVNTYTPLNAEDFVIEITMEEIAKKWGVNVNQIRIKK